MAALIKAAEDLVLAMSESDDYDEDEDGEISPLCLLEIENTSLKLKFAATHMLLVMLAWQNIGHSNFSVCAE